ncbi:hypothetical protein GCM10010439_73560 [Actinocorallia aurantiaca]|uniref:Uncharacterized protein n=1 Tax=Actinocorallia aurantiaca TaxID=46204 RepID=A0ABP6HBV9_9ACTN
MFESAPSPENAIAPQVARDDVEKDVIFVGAAPSAVSPEARRPRETYVTQCSRPRHTTEIFGVQTRREMRSHRMPVRVRGALRGSHG